MFPYGNCSWQKLFQEFGCSPGAGELGFSSAEPDAPSVTLAKSLRLSVPQFLVIKWEYWHLLLSQGTWEHSDQRELNAQRVLGGMVHVPQAGREQHPRVWLGLGPCPHRRETKAPVPIAGFSSPAKLQLNLESLTATTTKGMLWNGLSLPLPKNEQKLPWDF